MYTPGHSLEPQGRGPNDTIPAKNMNGFDRFVKSIIINGPPIVRKQKNHQNSNGS